MSNTLIISSSAEKTAELEQLLKGECSGKILYFSSGSEVRRYMQTEADIELAVVSSPLSDEFGHDLALLLSETANGVILICSGDISDEIAQYTDDSGIYVIPRPLSHEIFSDTVNEIISADGNASGNKKESAEILSKIEEIRLINRAKATLMKYLKFTEPQAHRYIEKQAMNSRRTRREMALHILSSYDVN